MAETAFQQDAFSGIFQMDYTSSFEIQEGADKASFSAGIYGTASFEIQENGPDVISVIIKGTNNFTFSLSEPKDISSFVSNVKTLVTFSLIERKDVASFQILAAAVVQLQAIDPTDIMRFRSFAAFFTEGDAAYIPIYPENRTITIRPVPDRQSIREPQFAGTKSVSSENRTISVGQRTLRKDEL